MALSQLRSPGGLLGAYRADQIEAGRDRHFNAAEAPNQYDRSSRGAFSNRSHVRGSSDGEHLGSAARTWWRRLTGPPTPANALTRPVDFIRTLALKLQRWCESSISVPVTLPSRPAGPVMSCGPCSILRSSVQCETSPSITPALMVIALLCCASAAIGTLTAMTSAAHDAKRRPMRSNVRTARRSAQPRAALRGRLITKCGAS